jgi:hypothetical protein
MHGGKVVDAIEGCDESGQVWATDTLLIHPKQDKDLIQLQYGCSQRISRRRVVVEHTTFIDTCIDMDTFIHRLRPRKGMPGQPPGSYARCVSFSQQEHCRVTEPCNRRTKFTAEDDEHLVHYLAAVTPDKAAGGRMGNEIYKQLVELVRSLQEDGFVTDMATIGC